jgi:hypothetical protein
MHTHWKKGVECGIFKFMGAADPMRLFISVMVQQMIGISCQSHYNEIYPEVKNYFSYHLMLRTLSFLRKQESVFHR